MIPLAASIAAMAAIFTPLLLRDAQRAEDRAWMRRQTRPIAMAFRGMQAAVGLAMLPALQQAVVAASDMQATMRRIEDAMTSAGARLAEEAERYANREDQ